MSETRNAKSKPLRDHKGDRSKTRTQQHYKESGRRSDMRPRTPPILARTPSMENLIKTRESLKQELKKIGNYSDVGDMQSKHKVNRHAISQHLKPEQYTEDNRYTRSQRSQPKRCTEIKKLSKSHHSKPQGKTDINKHASLQHSKPERCAELNKHASSLHSKYERCIELKRTEKTKCDQFHHLKPEQCKEVSTVSRHAKPEICTDLQGKKRRNSKVTDFNPKRRKHVRDVIEAVPEDYSLDDDSDSDDEETIIANRRQQRKLLMEKLNVHLEERHNMPNIVNSNESSTRNDDNESSTRNDDDHNKNTVAMKTKNLIKEIPDMFSDGYDLVLSSKLHQITQDNEDNNSHLADNWDDANGYYNIKIGDEINKNKYIIKSVFGQGVFANVVRALNKMDKTEVAIKIVRNNELMHKTGLNEIKILRQIRAADPENKYHCVKYLDHFQHKQHLCIVLEPLCLDLRSILKKYGRHGLNFKALVSYSRQLLIALRLLKKIGIVHADIKPDNILVNEKKNVLKLCDFGSAANPTENEPTPYMVSRFYRAPEVILGIAYKHTIDIWSAACTIFEMATGRILFAGSSNNKMLKCFMDMKGQIPPRLVRRGRFKDQHFNFRANFLLHKKDEFTGREKYVELPNIIPKRDLHQELQTYSKCANEMDDKKLVQLKELLDKMLLFDLQQRYTATDCLKHPFFLQEISQK